MTTYFELLDDVTIPGRWHLGEVLADDASEPRLRAGIPLRHDRPLRASITRPGLALEFSLTSFGVPLASAAVSRAVAAAAGSDVECLAVSIAGQTGLMVLNAVRLIRCIDESRSEFVKWTTDDHRADLAGQYRQVTRLALDSAKVPSDAHFFRIEGWPVALIVSDRVRAAMEHTGCLGAKFLNVSVPGAEGRHSDGSSANA